LTGYGDCGRIWIVTGSAGFCLNMANIAQLHILRQAVRLTNPVISDRKHGAWGGLFALRECEYGKRKIYIKRNHA